MRPRILFLTRHPASAPRTDQISYLSKRAGKWSVGTLSFLPFTTHSRPSAAHSNRFRPPGSMQGQLSPRSTIRGPGGKGQSPSARMAGDCRWPNSSYNLPEIEEIGFEGFVPTRCAQRGRRRPNQRGSGRLRAQLPIAARARRARDEGAPASANAAPPRYREAPGQGDRSAARAGGQHRGQDRQHYSQCRKRRAALRLHHLERHCACARRDRRNSDRPAQDRPHGADSIGRRARSSHSILQRRRRHLHGRSRRRRRAGRGADNRGRSLGRRGGFGG